MNLIQPTLQNSRSWGSLIQDMRHRDCPAFMKAILDLCISPDNTPHPDLEKQLAYAFTALINKLHASRMTYLFKHYSFSTPHLILLTDLCINSYFSPDLKTNDMNLILYVAGKTHRLKWAHYIFDTMVDQHIADATTYGTAIKVFGNEKKFSKVESAFTHLLTHRPIRHSQLIFGYGNMLHACFINHKYERAYEIFNTIKQQNLLNPVILSIMIKIAGENDKEADARQFMTAILNDPTAKPTDIKRASEHLLEWFPNSAPILRHNSDLSSSEESDNSLSDIHSPQSQSSPSVSPAIRKNVGVIGDHLSPEDRFRLRAAQRRNFTFFEAPRLSLSRFVDEQLRTERSPSPQKR